MGVAVSVSDFLGLGIGTIKVLQYMYSQAKSVAVPVQKERQMAELVSV